MTSAELDEVVERIVWSSSRFSRPLDAATVWGRLSARMRDHGGASLGQVRASLGRLGAAGVLSKDVHREFGIQHTRYRHRDFEARRVR